MKRGVDFVATAVVPLLHDGNGKCLLELRSNKCGDERGRWSNCGGGGIEHGETLEEALVREVQEEVGTKPFNIEYIGFREVFREVDGRPTHWLPFDFLAQVNPDEVTIMEPEMVLEHRWCSLAEFPEPLHSQFPFFLEKYKDILPI